MASDPLTFTLPAITYYMNPQVTQKRRHYPIHPNSRALSCAAFQAWA
jgi:hypothetical protein